MTQGQQGQICTCVKSDGGKGETSDKKKLLNGKSGQEVGRHSENIRKRPETRINKRVPKYSGGRKEPPSKRKAQGLKKKMKVNKPHYTMPMHRWSV